MSWWYMMVLAEKKHRGVGVSMNVEVKHKFYNEDVGRSGNTPQTDFETFTEAGSTKCSGLQAVDDHSQGSRILIMLIPYNSAAGSWSNPVKAIGQAESDLDALVEAQAETLCLGDLHFLQKVRRGGLKLRTIFT